MQDVRDGRFPTDMDGFLHVIDDARSSLESVLDGRSESELTKRKDAEGWSVKDHLYHLAVWERGIRYLLQGRPRHEGHELTEKEFNELDADGMNAIIFKKNRDRSLQDVRQVFRDEHRAMIEHLKSDQITWEDLQKPYAHYASHQSEVDDDNPVLFWVFGNTAGHFDEHQEWIEKILEQSGSDANSS